MVVLGSGSNAYGLARSAVQDGLKTVLADCRLGPAFFSRLASGRWLLPPPSRPERAVAVLAERLAKLKSGAFLIPTDEPWVNFLNNTRESLPGPPIIPIARTEVVNLVLKKSSMYKWCKANRIAQPQTRVFQPGQDWQSFLKWAMDHLPVIIKPDTKGIGDKGLGFYTADFHNPDSLYEWAGTQAPGGPDCTVLVQRLITGPGVKLNAWHGYRAQGGAVFMAGISKLRSRPPRLGGCTTAARFTADDACRQTALKLLQDLNYSGFFDLEFLITPKGGPPLFIELNPRPGNPIQAATIMGLNLPLLALAGSLGEGPKTSRIVSNRPGCWVDISVDPVTAMAGLTSNKERLTFNGWLASLGPGPVIDAYLDWRDPLVFPAACLRLAVLGFGQVLQKVSNPARVREKKAKIGKLDVLAKKSARLGMFIEKAHSLGFWHMAKASLATRFKQELVFFQSNLPVPPAQVNPAGELSWRKVTQDDARLLALVNPGFQAGEATRRLAQGETGWIFFKGGQPVHYLWQTTGRVHIEYLRAHLLLRQGDVLNQSIFTRREFRRQGIAARAHLIIMAHCSGQGYRRVLTPVAWWNYASRSCMENKCHMQIKGSAARRGIGPFSRLRATGGLSVNDRNLLFLA